eukprot:scaffold15161_cov49-Attheya_sp.AAC.1
MGAFSAQPLDVKIARSHSPEPTRRTYRYSTIDSFYAYSLKSLSAAAVGGWHTRLVGPSMAVDSGEAISDAPREEHPEQRTKNRIAASGKTIPRYSLRDISFDSFNLFHPIIWNF